MRDLIRFAHSILWIIAAFKWGDIKNWKKYYSSILFFGMGDLIYNLVFANKLLWAYNSDFLMHPFTDLYIISTIFACTTMIYISNLPKTTSKKIIYVVLWIVLYTGIEIGFSFFNMMTYYNGWNLSWSLIHNCYQFPLLKIHQDKPLLAWFISFVILGIMMYIYKVPLIIPKY